MFCFFVLYGLYQQRYITWIHKIWGIKNDCLHWLFLWWMKRKIKSIKSIERTLQFFHEMFEYQVVTDCFCVQVEFPFYETLNSIRNDYFPEKSGSFSFFIMFEAKFTNSFKMELFIRLISTFQHRGKGGLFLSKVVVFLTHAMWFYS